MVPRQTTIAVVEAELPAMQAYAFRHGWTVTWNVERLFVLAVGVHPADKSPARLHGDLTGYKAQPPAWRFITPDTDESSMRIVRPGPVPGVTGAMFHDNGVICAPFNRLAYAELGGPHGDWNGLSNWLNVRGWVSARNLGEMLAQILLHLHYSPGWKS